MKMRWMVRRLLPILWPSYTLWLFSIASRCAMPLSTTTLSTIQAKWSTQMEILEYMLLLYQASRFCSWMASWWRHRRIRGRCRLRMEGGRRRALDELLLRCYFRLSCNLATSPWSLWKESSVLSQQERVEDVSAQTRENRLESEPDVSRLDTQGLFNDKRKLFERACWWLKLNNGNCIDM